MTSIGIAICLWRAAHTASAIAAPVFYRGKLGARVHRGLAYEQTLRTLHALQRAAMRDLGARMREART